MPFSIELICEDKIVELRFTGTNTFEEYQQGKDSALRKCKSNGTSKLIANLKEIEFAGTMTTIELFEISESFNIQDLEPGFKVAALVSADRANDMNDVEFGSSVLRNEGYSSRPFSNFDEAVNWLLS